MSRVLVTGGAGFIGSNLVDALLARGREVTILDDLSAGGVHNLVGALNRRATLVDGCVTDADVVCRAMQPVPDTVFHLAAQIDVRRAVACLRTVDAVRGAPLCLQGDGDMAGVALYAALFEPEAPTAMSHVGNFALRHAVNPVMNQEK